MNRHLMLLATTLSTSLACLACSSEVTYLASASSSSSSSSSSTSSSGTGGSGATGGTGTGATGATGGSGGNCVNTNEHFEMALMTPVGEIYSCQSFNGTATGLHQFQGEVLESTNGSLVIDSCPPTAFCEESLYKLSYSSPGLQPSIPVGVFVDVTVRVDQPMGCSHELLIMNLPAWEGVPSWLPTDNLWLAGADGTPATLPGSPLTIAPIELPCWAGEWAKSYSLLFETNDANAAVDLHMGNTAEWSWNNGQFLMIRNLRSYETGADDDDWNWGWWAAGWLTLEG